VEKDGCGEVNIAEIVVHGTQTFLVVYSIGLILNVN
jgi:hypothetical protein